MVFLDIQLINFEITKNISISEIW